MITYLKGLKQYLKGISYLSIEYPLTFRLDQAIAYYPAWRKSNFNVNSSSLVDELPWITFPAIYFLEQFLTTDMKVFEYGMGGSTLFFARRVRELISVDHDLNWMESLSKITQRNKYENCDIRLFLIEAENDDFEFNLDPSHPDSYKSTDPSFIGKNFKSYAASIDNYPDEYFDLILIDGRARPSCFKHSVPKIKKNGVILLDNTDREYYLTHLCEFTRNTTFLDFPGFAPYLLSPSRTSAWQFNKCFSGEFS